MILALLAAVAATPHWVEAPSVVDGTLRGEAFFPKDHTPALVMDGAVVRDAVFRSVDDEGTTTLFSLDASGSFRRFFPAAISMLEPVGPLLDDGHDVGLMAFGRASRTWAFTRDRTAWSGAIDELGREAGTEKETRLAAFVLGGIAHVATARPAADGGHRRLVVFTDAGEESAVFDVQTIVETARSRDVRVDAVVFARTQDKSFAEDLDRLASMARGTGGTSIELHDDVVDITVVRDLLSEPSGRYRIEAPVCGQVDVRLGAHAPTTHLEGPPCSGSRPALVEHLEPGSPTAVPTRLAGLACLALVLLFTGGLIGLLVLLSRERVPTTHPQLPEAPPPSPSAPPDGPPPPPAPAATKSDVLPTKLPERHLFVVGGDVDLGTRWRFTGRILRVGANPEDNDVVVDLPQVSGKHARFELFPSGALFVEDLGSSNGTWVDGIRLPPHTRTEVPPGSTIALSSQLSVRVAGPSEAPDA